MHMGYILIFIYNIRRDAYTLYYITIRRDAYALYYITNIIRDAYTIL